MHPSIKSEPGVCRASLGIIVALTLAAMVCAPRLVADDDDGPPVRVPLRTTHDHGEIWVKLTSPEQLAAGVKAELPVPATRATRREAYAEVLDLRPLDEQADAVRGAAARLDEATAAKRTAEADLRRKLEIRQRSKGVSDSDVEIAQDTAKAAEATEAEARSTLELKRALFLRTWGPTLSRWVLQGAPEWKALNSGAELLVKITTPGLAPETVANRALVRVADRRWVSADLIAPVPLADPEIQGVGGFYRVAPGSTNLAPGYLLQARVPEDGPTDSGVIVPASAVVWWQGQSWVYVEISQGSFERHVIATDSPEGAGRWFVTGLPPGRPLVVKGAAVLLSEELRPAEAPDAD